MIGGDESFLLYSDEGGDSEMAIKELTQKGLDIRVEIAPLSERSESTYPRLLTSVGSFIGLSHIRLFAAAESARKNGGNGDAP